MNRHSRSLTSISSCLAFAVGAATLATATGQAKGTASRQHIAHRTTLPARCAVRNKARGTARIAGYLSNTTTLNPYQGNTPEGLFSPTLTFDNRLRMTPVNLTEIPTLKNGGIHDGGKTIILHLKHGLRWSNGAEMTAADWKFGWRINTDKATGPACIGPCGEIRTVQTSGRYTIIFSLKHLSPEFLTDGLPGIWPTRWPGAWKDDPHAAAIKLAKDPSFDFKGPNYPTSGPYQVAKVAEGKEVILKPMKYYNAMTCGGYIGTIVDEVQQSLASMLAEVVAGRLDLWDRSGRILDVLSELQRHSGFRVHIDPASGFEHMEFNVDPTYSGIANPLHDAKVRLALALALDKRLLIRTVLPLTARQARGILAWTPWLNRPGLVQPFADETVRGQWDPIAKSYVSDTGHGSALADARKLLASTRWKHGFTIDLHTPDSPRRRATVPVLTASWARIGVTVNATFQDLKFFDSWNNGGILAHGAFQVALFAYVGGISTTRLSSFLTTTSIDRRHSDHSLPGNNFSGIDNSKIDRAFATAGHTFSRKVRATNYGTVQRELNQHAYWVPLYFVPIVWTSRKHIRNVSFSAFGGFDWNVWAWKVGSR